MEMEVLSRVEQHQHEVRLPETGVNELASFVRCINLCFYRHMMSFCIK